MGQSTDYWHVIKAAASYLEYDAATIRKWKERGHVPAKHHYPLIKAARANGIELTIEQLNQ